jgi:hypothetical protein
MFDLEQAIRERHKKGRRGRGVTRHEAPRFDRREGEDHHELRAPSASMAEYEFVNERPSEHGRMLGTLARTPHQRFGG